MEPEIAFNGKPSPVITHNVDVSSVVVWPWDVLVPFSVNLHAENVPAGTVMVSMPLNWRVRFTSEVELIGNPVTTKVKFVVNCSLKD